MKVYIYPRIFTTVEWFVSLDKDEMKYADEILEEIHLCMEEQYPGDRIY